MDALLLTIPQGWKSSIDCEKVETNRYSIKEDNNATNYQSIFPTLTIYSLI